MHNLISHLTEFMLDEFAGYNYKRVCVCEEGGGVVLYAGCMACQVLKHQNHVPVPSIINAAYMWPATA